MATLAPPSPNRNSKAGGPPLTQPISGFLIPSVGSNINKLSPVLTPQILIPHFLVPTIKIRPSGENLGADTFLVRSVNLLIDFPLLISHSAISRSEQVAMTLLSGENVLGKTSWSSS
jgi:hypothetical protein